MSRMRPIQETELRPIENLDETVWEEIAKDCQYATFYHTPYWAKAFHETYPEHIIDTRGYILEGGNIAVLPLIRLKSFLNPIMGNNYQSMFPGVYGGLIAKDPLDDGDTRVIYKSLIASGMGHMFITGNPFSPFSPGEPYRKSENSTHVLHIEKGFEQIWDGICHGHKRMIKKARRLGVKVRKATKIEDVQAYYQVYEDSLRRWGKRVTSRYPYALFENLYSVNPEHVKLWLSEVEGRVVSGALVVYWNKHVSPWHGCSISEYFKYSPMHILQSEIIKDACERGYTYYDFNPSGGHEGSAKFKELMGAERMEFGTYVWESKTNKVWNYLLNRPQRM